MFNNVSDNFFKVHQRVVSVRDGQAYWRISLTTNAPLAIHHAEILGLAMQLDLTQAEVAAAFGTDAFPPQLVAPGLPPRPVSQAQWAYKPAVAALLALAEAKRWDIPE